MPGELACLGTPLISQFLFELEELFFNFSSCFVYSSAALVSSIRSNKGLAAPRIQHDFTNGFVSLNIDHDLSFFEFGTEMLDFGDAAFSVLAECGTDAFMFAGDYEFHRELRDGTKPAYSLG